ncbi:MAG TPA: hypothetical protein VFX22_07470 [Candidatus Kapabacteria bacterium]|nr:hypothetical protein [Candidatus Kapabacteria bacterium]
MDDQGHFEIPPEIRQRMGLRNGTRIKLEERNAALVVHPIEERETLEERKALQLAAIDAAIGMVPSDSKALEHLLEERQKDREQENRPFGV